MTRCNVLELNVGDLRAVMTMLKNRKDVKEQNIQFPSDMTPQQTRGFLIKTFPSEYMIGKQPTGSVGGRVKDRGIEYLSDYEYQVYNDDDVVEDDDDDSEVYSSDEEECDESEEECSSDDDSETESDIFDSDDDSDVWSDSTQSGSDDDSDTEDEEDSEIDEDD